MTYESLALEIGIYDKIITVLAVYRPPNLSEVNFIKELKDVLYNLPKNEVIVCGDINIDISDSLNMNTIKYKDMLAYEKYKRIIYGYTREEVMQGIIRSSSLDHIYYKGNSFSPEGMIIKSKISDHYMILSNLSRHKINSCKESEIRTPTTTIINSKLVKYNIAACNWTDILALTDPTLQYSAIYKNLKDIYNISSINNSDHRRKSINSWITNDIINKCKERDKSFRKWKNCPSNVNYRSDYKKFRNRLQNEIKKAKVNYYRHKFNKFDDNPKKLWELVNEITKRYKKRDLDIVKHFNRNITDKEVGNIFLNYYSNITEGKIVKCNLKYNINNIIPCENSIFIPFPTTDDVMKILKTVKREAPGWDGIRIDDLKQNKEFVQILCNFISNSINTATVPDDLKISIIRPIYKNGSKSNPSNYRPISILYFIDKILERYIANVLTNYLNKNKIISKYQYAFQKKKGTKIALEDFSQYVYYNLNK